MTIVDAEYVLFGCLVVALMGVLWVVDMLPLPWGKKPGSPDGAT